MNKLNVICCVTIGLAVIFLVSCTSVEKKTEQRLPNIVIINMDDLGYGDMAAYGAEGIPTPNMDRLANEGIRFTNGYATSSTCTPSRFGMLTGNIFASLLRQG